MSWNGTVRCSWCYEKGHNRRGCPHLKKHWQDILEDPDSSDYQKGRARAYFAKKERLAKKAAETRRCGYCGMPGHNRKTCKVLKHDNDPKTFTEDRNWQIKSWKENQKYFLNFLNENKLSKLYAYGSYYYLLYKILNLRDLNFALTLSYMIFYPLNIFKKILNLITKNFR